MQPRPATRPRSGDDPPPFRLTRPLRLSGQGGSPFEELAASGGVVCSSWATDATNNINVAGRFSASPGFNSDLRKANHAGSSSYGSGYVLKLTSAGADGWVSAFQTTAIQDPNGSALTIFDVAGNVAVVGDSQGETDFKPTASVDTRLTDTRLVDGLVVELASNDSLASVDASGATDLAGVWDGGAMPDVIRERSNTAFADIFVLKLRQSRGLGTMSLFQGVTAHPPSPGPSAGWMVCTPSRYGRATRSRARGRMTGTLPLSVS